MVRNFKLSSSSFLDACSIQANRQTFSSFRYQWNTPKPTNFQKVLQRILIEIASNSNRKCLANRKQTKKKIRLKQQENPLKKKIYVLSAERSMTNKEFSFFLSCKVFSLEKFFFCLTIKCLRDCTIRCTDVTRCGIFTFIILLHSKNILIA